MRINNAGPQAPGGPYNSLFQAYGSEVNRICVERATVGPDTYINVSAIEDSLLTFTRSGNTAVGVLYGHRGVGKSSVLRHLARDVWPKDGCAVILADLSETSAALQLGANYYRLPHIERWHHALGLASHCLATHIDIFIQGFLPDGDVFPFTACMDCMRVVAPQLLPLDAIYKPHDPAALLDEARRKDESYFRFFLMYFIVQHRGQHHLKFVLDNLDDKDSTLIKALCEQLAHLQSFFSACSTKEVAKYGCQERRMTPIVSCRPITYQHLLAPVDRENGDDWYGMAQIPFTVPCQLAAMLTKRYDVYVAGKRNDSAITVESELLAGQSLTLDSRDKLFRRLCNDFGRTGQADILLALCNYDLARAASAALEVFRNRHFLSTDEVISMAATSNREDRTEAAAKLFTPTTILRVMAYGNQATEAPLYPIEGTLVPNILESRVASFAHATASFVKPRIIMYFLEVKRRNGATAFSPGTGTAGVNGVVTRGLLLDISRTYFGLRDDIVSPILDEMFTQDLLAHNHGVRVPSVFGNQCELALTPRAECLWKQLAKSSVLLQAFRENVELDDSVSWRGEPHRWCDKGAYASDLSKGDVFLDLPWMCVQSWNVERNHIDWLLERHATSDFIHLFNARFVTEQLIDGVQESIRDFWSSGIKDQKAIREAKRILYEVRAEMSAKHLEVTDSKGS